MNELLDLLETRVAALVDEVQLLRLENEQLQQDLTDKTGSLAEENTTLKNALEEERNAREHAVKRIDGLLRRLADNLPG